MIRYLKKILKSKYFNLLLLFSLISGPIILIILPSAFFDHGQSICISVTLFNRECYACGITRAIMHLIHLEFKEALDYNKLVVLVFPLLVILWIKMIFSLLGKKILKWL
ncbi:MAG: hypothetical protein CL821_05835 [Crocinitomicaceae bacterium]|nr:hypothetical protein [Crocinitomicaceae bacterium]|tara:strand:- start:29112 stop:29438 length:327 start_codon:yes stop_codon:yes gene_type:complete